MFALSVFFEWLLYVCFLVLLFWYHEWLEFVEEQSNTRQIAIVKEVNNSHTVASEYTYCRWIWTIYCHKYLCFRLPCKMKIIAKLQRVQFLSMLHWIGKTLTYYAPLMEVGLHREL